MKVAFTARVLAILMLVACAVLAHGQAGSFDLSGGGGLADYLGGSKNAAEGLLEVSALVNVAAHAGVGFEYNYSPVSTVDQSFTGYVITGSAHLDHYGAVVRVPFSMKARVEPYATAHLGVLHEHASYSGFGVNVGTTQSVAYTGGYGGGGAGVSFFLSHGFGVRPELRYEYLRVNGSHSNELDVVASLFYRFNRHG